MPDLNLRDMPTRELLENYRSHFPNVNSQVILGYLDFQKTSQQAEQVIDQLLAKNGLTQTRFIVLMLLFRDPEQALKPSELAYRAGVKRATMTGVINGLLRQDWVEKIADPADGRAYSIQLTASGLTKIQAVIPQAYSADNQLMQSISPADFEIFTKVLKQINKNSLKLME